MGCYDEFQKAYAKKTVKQVHHLFSDKGKNKALHKKLFKKYPTLADNLNGDWNKITIPHLGRHTNLYHEYMDNLFFKIDEKAKGDPDKFMELLSQEAELFKKNPEYLQVVGADKLRDVFVDKFKKQPLSKIGNSHKARKDYMKNLLKMGL